MGLSQFFYKIRCTGIRSYLNTWDRGYSKMSWLERWDGPFPMHGMVPHPNVMSGPKSLVPSIFFLSSSLDCCSFSPPPPYFSLFFSTIAPSSDQSFPFLPNFSFLFYLCSTFLLLFNDCWLWPSKLLTTASYASPPASCEVLSIFYSLLAAVMAATLLQLCSCRFWYLNF